MTRRYSSVSYARRRFVALLCVVAVVLGGMTYGHVTNDASIPADEARRAEQVIAEHPNQVEEAVDALATIPIRERASNDDYGREQFGSGWTEEDGCDMRNRILQRDLNDIHLDTDGCTVLSGVLHDGPYTTNDIPFERGRTSSDIQIDHVVALSDAWQKGAQHLPPEERIEFANDPLNLLAVDGPANMQKGGDDASSWLPHDSYQCQYVARQIAIKTKHDLWVTQHEHNAMSRVLHTCPKQLLPIEHERTTP